MQFLSSFQHEFVWEDGHFLSFQLWMNFNFGKTVPTVYKPNHCFPLQYVEQNILLVQTSEMKILKSETLITIYPQTEKGVCVALMLTNLAQPEWITIDCDRSLSAHVVCAVPDRQNAPFQKKKKENALYKQGLVSCDPSCILFNDTCFLFLWLTDETKHSLEKKHIRTDDLSLKLNLTGFKLFDFVFDAVRVRFPPILSSDLLNSIWINKFKQSNTFMKASSVYHINLYPTNTQAFKGFYITTEQELLFRTGANIFKCQRSFVSQMDVCDQTADCPDIYRADEAECVCHKAEVYVKHCKHVNESHLKIHQTCSLFYIQLANGSCIKYSFEITSVKLSSKITINEKQTILNTTFRKIPTKLLSGFCCGKNTLHQFCQENGRFPCSGTMSCFELEDVCQFKQHSGVLLPCNTGEHIYNCQRFQCNAKFKCPNSYCIPWAYVCNGRWDCPHGLDEDTSCSSERQCVNMFKCKLASICINVHDLCDNTKDCPANDDEQLCSLMAFNCPSVCKCLAFAISCYHIASLDWELSHTFPWHAILVKNCAVSVAKIILQILHLVSILVVTQSNLTSVCDLHLPMQHVVLVDVRHNQICVIKKNCFVDLKYLKILKFNTNNLSELQEKSFYNLTNLLLLDLSENRLVHFTSDVLQDCWTIQYIFLHNNSQLNTVNKRFELSSLKLLSTTWSLLCCAIFENTTCQVEDLCIQSCSHLLTNTITKVLFCCAFVVVCLLSFAATISQRKAFKNKTKVAMGSNAQGIKKANNKIMIFFQFHDFLFAWYYGVLFVVDQAKGDNFCLYQNKWKANFFCYLIFFINLQYHLFSPILFTLFSFSRMMVVMYPMDTKFKDPKFIGKLFSASGACTVIATLFVTSAAANIYGKIPTNLCSFTIELCNSTLLINVIRWTLLLLQIICSILCVIANTELLMELKSAQERVHSYKATDTSEALPIGQCVSLLVTNIICWIPPSVTYITCSFKNMCPAGISEWITVTIQPLNSVVVPIVFIIKRETSS